MNAMLLAHQGSDPRIARAIVLTGVAAALVTGLVFSQSRLRRAAAANHDRSITDPLTGLANLRGLRARLRQELQRSTRDESEIVMFAIDLDDFKEVNDRFSYALGDAVLQAVAQALAEEVEPGDLLARRGGDEFAILTVATPGRHMARFGDRIAASIERTRRAICPGVNPRASVTRVTHEPRRERRGVPAPRRRRPARRQARRPPRAPGQWHPTTTGDHPQVALDEHNSRALAGARRAHDGRMRRGGRSTEGGSVIDWRMTAAAALVPAALISIVVLAGLLPSAERLSTLVCVVGLLALRLRRACSQRAASSTAAGCTPSVAVSLALVDHLRRALGRCPLRARRALRAGGAARGDALRLAPCGPVCRRLRRCLRLLRDRLRRALRRDAGGSPDRNPDRSQRCCSSAATVWPTSSAPRPRRCRSSTRSPARRTSVDSRPASNRRSRAAKRSATRSAWR